MFFQLSDLMQPDSLCFCHRYFVLYLSSVVTVSIAGIGSDLRSRPWQPSLSGWRGAAVRAPPLRRHRCHRRLPRRQRAFRASEAGREHFRRPRSPPRPATRQCGSGGSAGVIFAVPCVMHTIYMFSQPPLPTSAASPGLLCLAGPPSAASPPRIQITSLYNHLLAKSISQKQS